MSLRRCMGMVRWSRGRGGENIDFEIFGLGFVKNGEDGDRGRGLSKDGKV